MKTRIIGGDLVGGSRSEWGALCVTQRALQGDVSDTEQTTRRKYLGAGCSHYKQHNDHNLSQSYQLSFLQTKIWRDNDNLMRVTQSVVRRCEPPCTNYLTLPTSFDRKKLQIEMTRPTSCHADFWSHSPITVTITLLFVSTGAPGGGGLPGCSPQLPIKRNL